MCMLALWQCINHYFNLGILPCNCHCACKRKLLLNLHRDSERSVFTSTAQLFHSLLAYERLLISRLLARNFLSLAYTSEVVQGAWFVVF